MYGGTFNFPIPFLGISIVDFDFRHTGAQLSTFFAGPILVSDLSKQFRPKFRLALDLSLNGLPGENRIYSNNTELLQGEVWTWEQTTGLRASWQATTHLSVTASTYFAYDNFLRTSQADEQYELPRNGLNILPGVEIKYNRKGYVFDAQGTRGERIDWRPFGCTSLALPPAGCGSSLPNPPPQNALLVAASAKCVHALQRRFEQGLLHRKVHQGRMGSFLLGRKSTGSLLALLPLVSCVAASPRHSPRHGFF